MQVATWCKLKDLLETEAQMAAVCFSSSPQRKGLNVGETRGQSEQAECLEYSRTKKACSERGKASPFPYVEARRPLTEEEIIDLQERHYDSIAEKQKAVDRRIQRELALQEEKLRLEEEALYAAQREAARAARQRALLEQEKQRVAQRYHPSSGDYQSAGPEDDFESCLRNTKSQYEVFRSSRLSSDATVLTPNTESSCDLMTKTKSTSGNDDSTSLDLEWEDEEGMNRMMPMRERSKTEEDILRAALRYSSKKGSNPTSASDDSNGLEWENDFVSAEMDDNGNSEYSGFVNPVLELSDSAIQQSDTDQQIR